MINVVYDVDDVLNNLNEYATAKAGVDMSAIKYFNIRKNTNIPEDGQDRLLELYGNPDTFRHLSFLDAAYHICDIEKEFDNVYVSIHSNNFAQEIADIKTSALLAEIPGITSEKISMEVGSAMSKSAHSEADIIVEDSFQNCLKYSDDTIKILINKSWNQAENYDSTDKESGITRVESLEKANELIREIVRNWDNKDRVRELTDR